MRNNGNPYLISETGQASALERLELTGQGIQEHFLQNLLDQSPGILPISRFDAGFDPVTSLGREILAIDNLFISPTGRLTVVETKLWRNPQATRHVLAQMLDYASRLSSLSYEKFEQLCQSANQSPLSSNSSLYQHVQGAFPEEVPAEAEFVDQVQRGLKSGRFLLLVVGDGIREGLEQVLDALLQQSRLHFTFGLVELQLYRHPGREETLAIPQIVAHSTEIERAVVTIRGAESDQVNVEVSSGPAEKAPKLTEQEFLASVKDPATRTFLNHLFEWAREHAAIQVTKTSIVIRAVFSPLRKGLILLRVYRTGKVLVTPPKLRMMLQRREGGDEVVLEIADSLKRLFSAIRISPEANAVASPLEAREILPEFDRFIEIYSHAIRRIQMLDPDQSADDLEMDDEEDNGE